MCVQNSDDSRGPAIRTVYRILLRSSSWWEPRHTLLQVVIVQHYIPGVLVQTTSTSTVGSQKILRLQVNRLMCVM